MNQDIFIIGANGNVGSTLVEQIFEKGDTDSSLHKNPTRIVGLASLSSYTYDSCGLSKDLCYKFSRRKDDERRYDLNELLKIAGAVPHDGNLVFVDVTAAKEPMKDFHTAVIERTNYGLVTSNKNPVTMIDYPAFIELTKDTRRYGFRCSVMAGANAIDELKNFRDLGDNVRSIEGCFSGTLGYICSELQKGEKFSEIVKEAKKQGYTEPHPADDLSGVDVAKKLLILARTAGINVDMKNISRTPLIPEEYFIEKDAQKFVENLSKLDKDFSKSVRTAKESKRTLRYVASLTYRDNEPFLRVGPELVPQNSALGMLNDKLNKIVIITDTYTPEEPCIIEAPGAGLKVTAQNVRRDLLQQIKDRRINYTNNQ